MSATNTLYAPTQNPDALDERVRQYLPLVRHIVGRIPVRLQPFMDADDLFSVGVLGLINAAKTYDPSMGASFKTHAYTNIKGAILDELRRHDPIPRSARDRMKRVDEAAAMLQERLGRPALPEEIASETGIPLKALEEVFLASRTTVLLSLDDREGSLQEKGGLLDALADSSGGDPAELAEKAEMKELLVRALENLPEAERQVVFLYYHQGLLLKEIGAVLEVSESRICQILGRAHHLLNREMTGRKDKSGSKVEGKPCPKT